MFEALIHALTPLAAVLEEFLNWSFSAVNSSTPPQFDTSVLPPSLQNIAAMDPSVLFLLLSVVGIIITLIKKMLKIAVAFALIAFLVILYKAAFA